MGGNIKLSATVISCLGKDSDRDDFYFNGNFSNCHNTESIQCSFEKSLNNYVFAVSDSIGIDSGELDGISAIKEIKRYHERAKEQQFALETITERIYEAVQLSSNLIYSKSIITNQNSSTLTGFSSLIIDNNRAVVMNLGNNGVFLFRQGEQKEVFARNGSRKNEKLKMLGISPTTDIYQDAEKILKLAEEESKTKIKLSSSFELEEGDILILCSDGLLNSVSKSRIESVVDSGFDPSKMASVLFQEAVKNGIDDSITVMAIRVDEIKNVVGNKRPNIVPFENDLDDEDEEDDDSESRTNIVNYILAFVCILVISGVLFMGYLIFTNSNILSPGNSNTAAAQTSLTSSDTSDTSPSTDSATADQTVTASEANAPVEESKDNNQEVTSEPDKQNAETNGSQSDNQGGNSEYDIHIVKTGDTLSSISFKYYGDPNKYDQIIKYNNLKNENSLYVDQELKIPKIN